MKSIVTKPNNATADEHKVVFIATNKGTDTGLGFQDKIPKVTFDCVLMLLRHGGSKHAKVTGKE